MTTMNFHDTGNASTMLWQNHATAPHVPNRRVSRESQRTPVLTANTPRLRSMISWHGET
jgi:hypothetical protein